MGNHGARGPHWSIERCCGSACRLSKARNSSQRVASSKGCNVLILLKKGRGDVEWIASDSPRKESARYANARHIASTGWGALELPAPRLRGASHASDKCRCRPEFVFRDAAGRHFPRSEQRACSRSSVTLPSYTSSLQCTLHRPR